MSYALAQDAAGANFGAANVAKLFGLPTTAGGLITASVGWNSGSVTITGVTDEAGNTYQAAHAVQTNDAGNKSRQLWYAYNCAAHAANIVTVAFSGNPGWSYLTIQEWSGAVGAGDPLVEVDLFATLSTSAPYDYSQGTVTPLAVGDLVYTTFKLVEARTWDAYSWTGYCDAETGIWPVYTLAASTAPVTPTMSLNGDSEVYGVTVLFKADTATWVDIADFHERRIDASLFPAGVGRCLCTLWAPGDDAHPPPIRMWARLVSLLETRDAEGKLKLDAVVGTSAEVTSAVPADGTFAVTLTGNKCHKVQVTSPTTETALWCAPDAEVRS